MARLGERERVMRRREFLSATGMSLMALASTTSRATRAVRPRDGPTITMFLCGDVMTGRGVDQILPRPSAPVLHESYVKNAAHYVELAEAKNGPIRRPVDFSYIWGDALDELTRRSPDVRIINLETAVTASDDPWPGKGIHYRMHPQNVPCLSAAGVTCCVLANNHVLDWGYAGLVETLDTLQEAGIKTAGAGDTQQTAAAPAVLPTSGDGRVLVFGLGSRTSGIPADWAATPERGGVNFTAALSDETAERIAADVDQVKRAGDLAVLSIHWGGNWGYEIVDAQRRFAHRVIDAAGIDVVHGHSSHHPRACEVYRERPILYGCGDFLNDYEGIGGYEQFRSDLVLAYFVRMDPRDGRLVGVEMTPFRTRRLRLERASLEDAVWLRDTLNREPRTPGTSLELSASGSLTLGWS